MPRSTLDPFQEHLPDQGKGHDVNSLGPSDSSDSGSDVRGARRKESDLDDALDQHALTSGSDELEGDSDRAGTGDRASADGDQNLVPDADILPDHQEDIEEGEADATPRKTPDITRGRP